MTITATKEGLTIKTKVSKVIFGNGDTVINSFTLQLPGEYEVGGIHVRNFGQDLLLHIENIPVAYLDSTKNNLAASEMDEIAQADILLIHVEQAPEMSKALSSLVSKIDPRQVIILGQDQSVVDLFAKEFAVEPIQETKLIASDLPEEGRNTIVMLCPKNTSAN